MRLPVAESPNRIVQMIQDFGSALFKIEKKSTPHFGVQTPYLAAVVKARRSRDGRGDDAKVKVSEGAVEVSTLDGGASDLVTPGSLAMVAKATCIG
jgi:ferric-dicitrate binding protein FerR (iron transport regulator)